MNAKSRELRSRQSSPDDFFYTDSSVFDFLSNVPRIQLVKPTYQNMTSDETLLDLGILSSNQPVAQANQASNVSYLNTPQFLLPQGKEDSVELEDYVQGLNDRFDLADDPLLPMTPRCSFEQGRLPLIATC